MGARACLCCFAACLCLLLKGMVVGVCPHLCRLVACSCSPLVGDGGGSCCLVLWHCCSVSSWLSLLVGPLVTKQGWWSRACSSLCVVGHSRSWTMVEGACQWWWGAGSRLLTVVVVGTPWGAWFIGDVALPHLWPGLLLWWVTSMVVVRGIISAMGTSFGW